MKSMIPALGRTRIGSRTRAEDGVGRERPPRRKVRRIMTKRRPKFAVYLLPRKRSVSYSYFDFLDFALSPLPLLTYFPLIGKSVSYKVRSLLDPPVVEKIVHRKTGVHPHTSFDYAGSAGNTPAGSEDEAEFCDIKKAQNLSIYMSPVDQTVPNRVIRTIIRGDFTEIQEQAQKGHGRLRKYLVATDLSEEAVYALEWTIGTILRDGDTLYAIYAVDEDAGTGLEAPSSPLNISDGARAVHDIAATVGSQTEQTAGNVATTFPQSRLSQVSAGGSESKPGSTDSRAMSKTDVERLHAIENISQTCIRLLRKTRLQVRVAVEVIHCKTPKHLITEAVCPPMHDSLP
jgi:hypothetical protein